MITIKRNNNKIVISGHALYDEYGKDIVCSSVSSIVTTTVNGIISINPDAIYYEIKNDAGEIVRYEGVTADGDIFIKCTEQYQDQFSMEYEVKQYTKRKRYGIQFHAFDKTFDAKLRIPFKTYETKENHIQISVTENFILPFSVKIFTYQEYEGEMRKYTMEEIESLAKKRYVNKYKNILQKGVQIIEKDVKIERDNQDWLLRGNIIVSEPVRNLVPYEKSTEGAME